MSTHRVAATLLALVLVLAACTGGDTPVTDGTTEAGGSPDTAAPTTALGALDAAASAGTDSVTLAVTEFSLLVGEVPGALPIAPDDSLPLSATGAVTAVDAVWDRLDDEQQAAVRAHLEPWVAAAGDADRTTDVLAAGTSATADRHGDVTLAMGRTPVVLARAPDDDVLAELGDAAAHVFGSLGGELPAGVLVQQSRTPLTEGDAITRAGWLTVLPGMFENAFAGTFTGRDCRMVLGPAVPSMPLPVLRSLAAHEMFHCWSVINSPDYDGHIATPAWYQEGVAAWIGEQYAGGTTYSTNWWRHWLTPATRSVYVSSYQAIGFWAWTEVATGGALLAQVPELHRVAVTGDDAALYAAVVQALDDELVTGLAASRSRQPGWGPRWDLVTPGITSAAVDTDPPVDLTVGTTRLEAAPGALATDTYLRPDSRGRVLGLTLATDGHVRARWSDGTELVAPGGSDEQRWCLADPCECPDGTALPGWEVLPASAEELTVAATGAATDRAIARMTVEQLCEDDADDPAPAAEGDGPLLGTWRSQPSSMIAELNEVFADTFSNATYTGGDVLLTFSAGGVLEITYDQVTVLLRSTPDGPSVPLEITGGGTLDYTVDGSTMLFSGADWEVVFRLAGVDGELPIADEDVGRGPPTRAVWGINQGTLTLQGESSDVFLPNQYRQR